MSVANETRDGVERDYLPQFAAEVVKDLQRIHEINPNEKNVAQLIRLVREAEHMVLPKNGEIYRSADEFPTEEECESFVGIPAPVLTIEFAMDGAASSFSNSVRADACLLLVLDHKQIDEDTIVEDLQETGKKHTYVSFVIFWRFSPGLYSKHPELHWSFCDHHMNVLSPMRVIKNGGSRGIAASAINMETRDAVPEGDPQIPGLMSNYKVGISAILQACHSLNVGATLEPRKEKSYTRSRKFEKLGVGGFEYHVLKLPTGTVRETLSGQRGAERDGPRYHFRRAHLRKLPTGIQTFVKSCFVGNRDKGAVAKDYMIPIPAEATA